MIAAVHHGSLLGGFAVLGALSALAALPALFGILAGRRDGR